MKRNELRLLWPFYVTALITSSFSVALPVWIIFFEKRFSFVQISFALSLQSLAGILFEIPTGAVADAFGRKVSVVLGIFLQGILWLALPFINLNIVLYFAFFIMGILRTLESGADKAWIVDWLKENHQGSLIQEMFLKIHSLHSAGFVISSLLASLLLLSSLDIRFLFFMQGCGYIIESFLLFFFAEENVHKRKWTSISETFHNSVQATQKGLDFLLKSKQLLYFVLATAFAVCSKDFGCIAWQPLLVGLSLPVKHLGVVFSIAGVTGIIAPFLTRTLLKKFDGEKHYLACTTLFEFALLALLYFISNPFFTLGVMVYIAVTLISDMQSPVGSMYFQSIIPSDIRATMGSVQSMILAIFSLVVSILGGYTMDKEGPKTAVVYFSLFLVPASLLYLMIKSKSKRPRPQHAPGRERESSLVKQPVRTYMTERAVYRTKLSPSSRVALLSIILPAVLLPESMKHGSPEERKCQRSPPLKLLPRSLAPCVPL